VTICLLFEHERSFSMTVLSLTQARRCLGIDAKTFHRWLTKAHLPLQNYPHDGRKKGISLEHLELLAHLHQRSLLSSSEQPVPLVPSEPTVSALTEMVSALQAQVATLQQQIADLSTRLLQDTPPPVSPSHPLQPASSAKPRSRPRTAAAPKAPPKPVHVIPRVAFSAEGRYVILCPTRGILSVEPDTPEWFAWVAAQSSFRFVGKEGHFTAHHEWTTPNGAWRAHRQIRNHSYNLHLAPNQHLTISVLEQAAQTLQAHLA
jgi:hypothetical protein